MPTDPALAELYEARAQTYAAFGNGAIAVRARELLPPQGSVLDLGCASGGLLALLRGQASHLAGLELSETAAMAAAQVADLVVQGALEDRDLPFEAGFYDLVVLADVLEHLADPDAALRRATGWCKPGGAILISVPNVAHWRARLTLVRGRWPAEERGTFDASHLRWFTRDSVADAARRCRPRTARARRHRAGAAQPRPAARPRRGPCRAGVAGARAAAAGAPRLPGHRRRPAPGLTRSRPRRGGGRSRAATGACRAGRYEPGCGVSAAARSSRARSDGPVSGPRCPGAAISGSSAASARMLSRARCVSRL